MVVVRRPGLRFVHHPLVVGPRTGLETSVLQISSVVTLITLCRFQPRKRKHKQISRTENERIIPLHLVKLAIPVGERGEQSFRSVNDHTIGHFNVRS